jgi:hypothetical protein
MRGFRVPPSPALEEMLARDAGEPPPPPGPVERVEPLLPLPIPKPDWREEEARAVRQNEEVQAGRRAEAPKADNDLATPARSLERPDYPAKPKSKAEKSATPNLDRIKRELGRS